MQTLDSALAQAAVDPAARPEFFRILLESEIYLIGTSGAEGRELLPPGEQFSLMLFKRSDGTTAVPFFSSLEALQRGLEERTGYFVMKARSFFEMTRGMMVVLNPGSDYGKEFAPDEIASLLHTGKPPSAVREINERSQVKLGPPADYPAVMVEALAEWLAQQPRVDAAYLCAMHDPSAGKQPSLLVGLQGAGDLVPVFQAAEPVVNYTAPSGTAVDFVQIRRGERGISQYMLTSVTPFYQRAKKRGWGAGLLSLVGAGR